MDSTPGNKPVALKYRLSYVYAKQRSIYLLNMATLDVILVWRFDHQRRRFELIV